MLTDVALVIGLGLSLHRALRKVGLADGGLEYLRLAILWHLPLLDDQVQVVVIGVDLLRLLGQS